MSNLPKNWTELFSETVVPKALRSRSRSAEAATPAPTPMTSAERRKAASNLVNALAAQRRRSAKAPAAFRPSRRAEERRAYTAAPSPLGPRSASRSGSRSTRKRGLVEKSIGEELLRHKAAKAAATAAHAAAAKQRETHERAIRYVGYPKRTFLARVAMMTPQQKEQLSKEIAVLPVTLGLRVCDIVEMGNDDPNEYDKIFSKLSHRQEQLFQTANLRIAELMVGPLLLGYTVNEFNALSKRDQAKVISELDREDHATYMRLIREGAIPL